MYEERRLIRLRVRGLIVRMEPGFGLLPGGRDLGLRHLGGQAFKARLTILVTLGKRELRPEIRFGKILRNSAARPIVSAQRGLGANISLLGRALEPLHG